MIVIAGKNNIAVHALESLSSKVGKRNIVVLPNSNDSGNDSWQRSLVKKARDLDVRTAIFDEIKDDKSIECFISLEYDKIIDPSRLPENKVFNIHFSDLPSYKGMYTSYWPIVNYESTSGVTLHKIDRGIDTGAIIDKRTFSINENDRAIDLYRKYISNAIDLFDANIDSLLAGDPASYPQTSVGSTYFSKNSVNYVDLAIDLNVTAWQLRRQIYAYSFRPYQLPIIHGQTVVEVEITGQQSFLKPGSVVNEGDSFIILSTIDFDVIVHFDGLNDLLSRISAISLQDFKEGLNNIAGVNDKNNIGWSPLIVAVYCGRQDLVSYLLSVGANINDTNYKGTSVLMYAKDYCLRSRDLTLLEYLIKSGADANVKDYSGNRMVDYLSLEEFNFIGSCL